MHFLCIAVHEWFSLDFWTLMWVKSPGKVRNSVETKVSTLGNEQSPWCSEKHLTAILWDWSNLLPELAGFCFCVAGYAFDRWRPSCQDGVLSKAKLANFCLQIVEGMCFLASKRVCVLAAREICESGEMSNTQHLSNAAQEHLKPCFWSISVVENIPLKKSKF